MSQEQALSNKVWNVPNVLSAIRLLMAFVVFALIPLHFYIPAFILFVIAAGTDWVDGWWARRFNQVTQLGRILDPFCDKIIICGTYILIAVEMADFPWYYRLAGWMAVVVVGREMLVTALRGFIEQSGGDFSAKMAGKLKMVFQCFAVGACLLALNMTSKSEEPIAETVPTWLVGSLVAFIWLSVISTIYSGAEYVMVAAKFIRNVTFKKAD